MKTITRCLPLLLCSLSAASFAETDIDLFVKKTNANWQIAAENPDGRAPLTGSQIKAPNLPNSSAPNSDVVVSLASKNAKDDALQFSWKETWRAGLTFSSDKPANLRGYENGVIAFDLKVDDLTKGGLALKFNCGKSCERQLPFLFQARAISGKGWQSFAVPLKCFVHDGDDIGNVPVPFALESGGAGQVVIANVKIKSKGKANVSCPDYKTLSVTPEPLNEWWALDWWMPRHEKKLQELKSRPIDLVFIGDSITEGWEKSGAQVWRKFYGSRNAIALGFGGDRTENVLWRLLHGEVDGINPKVAVLMFGTNNTGHRHEDPALIAKGIQRDIDELRKRLPNTKILLLAIFPRDEKPDGDARQNNERVNALIREFADNKSVFFLDINKHFLDADGVLSKTIMPDLLHPNEKGYDIWANAMEPQLQQLLK